MKSLFRLLLGLLLLGSAAGHYLQWQAREKLHREHQRLEKENDELFRFSKEQIEVELGKREKELTLMRAQTQDLTRLRGEVTQLRTATKDLDRLRAEYQQVRAENLHLRGVAKSNVTASAPPVADPAFHAKESWAFSGYATPVSTLQSVLWAMREGDVKTLLASVTPEERSRLEEQIARESEAKILEGFKKNTDQLKSVRVLERKAVGDDAVELSVYPDDGDNKVGKLLFKRVGNEWRFAGKSQRPAQP